MTRGAEFFVLGLPSNGTVQILRRTDNNIGQFELSGIFTRDQGTGLYVVADLINPAQRRGPFFGRDYELHLCGGETSDTGPSAGVVTLIRTKGDPRIGEVRKASPRRAVYSEFVKRWVDNNQDAIRRIYLERQK